ncbi:hypothetical protein [Anaerotignum neopropionicum]|uniref:hypothetical protein n=1 Tax=Anaerotignum neopropionicum TaxID=36847 RepID=UPI0012FD5233|nr:hypothetical protein [Anaerotignum neopropionicum]
MDPPSLFSVPSITAVGFTILPSLMTVHSAIISCNSEDFTKTSTVLSVCVVAGRVKSKAATGKIVISAFAAKHLPALSVAVAVSV